MRTIKIAAKSIEDSIYKIEYQLFLDDDENPLVMSFDLNKILEIGKDYLTTPEYHNEFISRIARTY